MPTARNTRPSVPWRASRACAPRPTHRRTGELCHPVPRQPPGQALREGAAAGQHSVQGVGGTSFFDRAEIRDLCAWFRLWINQDDDPAFLRAITSPKRGIGHTTLGALGQFATQHRQSLFAALFSPMLPAALPRRALDGLHEFGRYVNDLEYRARHTLGQDAARTFLADWLKEIDYEKHLYDGEDSEKVALHAGPTYWSFVTGWPSAGGQVRKRPGAW